MKLRSDLLEKAMKIKKIPPELKAYTKKQLKKLDLPLTENEKIKLNGLLKEYRDILIKELGEINGLLIYKKWEKEAQKSNTSILRLHICMWESWNILAHSPFRVSPLKIARVKGKIDKIISQRG